MPNFRLQYHRGTKQYVSHYEARSNFRELEQGLLTVKGITSSYLLALTFD